jgi:hypothetical protein
MMRRLAVLLAILPVAAMADPHIESCRIDLPATEGAEVLLHYEGDALRLASVTQYGETLRQEMDLLPLAGDNAVLSLRVIRYSRHIAVAANEPFVQTLAGTVRAILSDGSICSGAACFLSTDEDLTRDVVQDLYDTYVERFPSDDDCETLYPG